MSSVLEIATIIHEVVISLSKKIDFVPFSFKNEKFSLGKTHDILVVVYSIVEITVEIKYSDLWPRMWTTKCVSLSQMQSTIMFYSLFCVLVQY